MTKKKKIIIALSLVIALVILASLAYFLGKRGKKAEVETVVKKRISSDVNIIDISKRPFIQLAPSADGHHVLITLIELKKPATSLSYEMEYQTGSMLQGFQGVLEFDTLPVTDRKLFGSQSAGGAITYHEDIKGGSLLAEFRGEENYAVKSNWRYFTNRDRQSEFSSQDTKFTISNSSLTSYSYLIIYNTPGYPGEIEGELISEIYTVSAEKSLKTLSSEFTVTFNSKEEQAQILAYNGQEWQELETSYDDGQVSGSAAFMDAYLLIKKD